MRAFKRIWLCPAQCKTAAIKYNVAGITSAALIAKWHSVLHSGQVCPGNPTPAPDSLCDADQLRELLKDAVSVYKAEAVVPDGVTDVLITAYRQLRDKQQQTAFFTLLAREFGVQRELQHALQ